MLSRSLTSCLIKPLANDFVSVINSICSLKRSAHIVWRTLLGAARGLSCYMVIEVYGVFPFTRVGSCSLKGNGCSQGQWAAVLYSHRQGVCVVSGWEKREGSSASSVNKLVIMAEN